MVADCLSRLLYHSLSKNLIATHPIGASSFILDHLQFADGTLFFSTADCAALICLFEIFHVFVQASDLFINLSKSELLGIHIFDDDLDLMVVVFGCKKGQWPAYYLGLPLGGNSKLISSNKNSITENMPTSQRVVVIHLIKPPFQVIAYLVAFSFSCP